MRSCEDKANVKAFLTDILYGINLRSEIELTKTREISAIGRFTRSGNEHQCFQFCVPVTTVKLAWISTVNLQAWRIYRH